MYTAFVATSALALASAAIPADKLAQQDFSAFIKEHGKQYSTEDFFNKFEVFKANQKHIEEHNASEAGWTMQMNQFGDLTADEFKAKYMGYNHRRSDFLRSLNTAPVSDVAAPASVDWRTQGAVTPVKDQAQCGSCWAFSTVAGIEGRVQIATGKLSSLSEQQLVDCAGQYGNQGCNGGLMDDGFQYVMANKGLCTEDDYPYKGVDGSCQAQGCTAVSAISSFTDVQSSTSGLEQAVAAGPVSVAIEADQSSFQFYSGGVMDSACGQQLDHGVTAVGYGTDGGKDYWIVKNSWGASWGEAGYIRIGKGNDLCGIHNSASFPVV